MLEPLMDLAILMASVADEDWSVELLTLVRGVASIDRRTESKAERLVAEQAAARLLAQGRSQLTRELRYFSIIVLRFWRRAPKSEHSK
jgi:hypothetical protein